MNWTKVTFTPIGRKPAVVLINKNGAPKKLRFSTGVLEQLGGNFERLDYLVADDGKTFAVVVGDGAKVTRSGGINSASCADLVNVLRLPEGTYRYTPTLEGGKVVCRKVDVCEW
jgi:hypothetical protein